MLKKHKKIIIIATIILIIILLLIALIPRIQQKALEEKTYSSIQEIPSTEAAVALMKCKYIKEEASSSKSYNTDIYLEFDKPLYDGNESNEIYYSLLTQLVADVKRHQSFRLIDEKNDIVVAVLCSDGEIQRTIINGDSNYYGRAESLKNLQEFSRPTITNIDIQSTLLNNLITNEWNAKALDLEIAEELEDKYFLYPETGVEIKSIKNKVFNIIFKQTYEEPIVNGLNANSTFEQVVTNLGNPTFGSIEEQTIGYKANELYVFFTEDSVSIYRVEKYNTSEFEKEMLDYQEKNNIKTHISNITDIWSDYDNYYYDANTIDLSYVLKGVKIQYSMTINNGVTYYTNYQGKVNNKEIEELTLEDIPSEVYFENKDAVAEYELARAEKHRLIEYGEDREQ